MRSRGFKWSQATVWSIEKGERPLRLGEALAVTEILGRPLDDLAGHNDSAATAVALSGQIEDAHESILNAFARFDDLRGQLAIVLDHLPHDSMNERIRRLSDWIETTPFVVVEHYLDRVQAERAKATEALSRLSDEGYAVQPGTWLGRLNEVEESVLKARPRATYTAWASPFGIDLREERPNGESEATP